MEGVTYRKVVLPRDVSERIQRLTKHYNLRFAAIDMVVSASGVWYFLEVNPNGQWAWLDLNGVANIAESFVDAFAPESSPSRGNEHEESTHGRARSDTETDHSVSS